MGLLDQFKAYVQANTPRATTPRVSPGKVINQGLLNPNQFNAPAANRFKDSLFGGLGIVPGVGDVAAGMEAADLWNRGDKGMAALAGLGMLPIIPSMVGLAKRPVNALGEVIPPTKYELAHEEARKNAVKMLGLPESNTAMDRAKALGADLERPLYHGSMHDVSNVDLSRSDIGGHAGQGFYMTPSPEDASINYANINGPDVRQRIQGLLEQSENMRGDTRDNLARAFYDDKIHGARLEKVLRGTGGGDNLGTVYPVYAKHGQEANLVDPKKSAYLDAGEVYDEALDDYIESADAEKWGNLFSAFEEFGAQPPEVLYEMLNEGARYDNIWDAIQKSGVEAYDEMGNPLTSGSMATEALKAIGANTVTHPTNFKNPQLNIAGSHTIGLQPTGIIRSKFAAFDPARAHESDLLAGLAPYLGVGGLLSLGLLGPNEEQQY